MQFADVPSWTWQVLGAAAGLGLGLLLGAWHLRRGKGRRKAARSAPNTVIGRSGSGASQLSGQPSSVLPGQSRFGQQPDSPQHRLLEHLRQSNLDLGAQLRASAAQHARLLKEKDEEVALLKDDYDQRVEELRQTHSSELKHLMTLLVEQVDGIHKAHANHVKALEAEIERTRRMSAATDREAADTTTFATTEVLASPPRHH